MKRRLIEEPFFKWPLVTLYLILATTVIIVAVKLAE